jgi:hypothetical protein
MFDRLIERLTYANVMSTLAVFIALGGSSYAAIKINGSSIRNRSVAATKLRYNTLGGREINESALEPVPFARNTNQLNGLTARDLKMKCQGDSFPIADVCVERAPRTAASYSSAVQTCLWVGTPAGPGRRLPTHGELMAALAAVQLSPGGELTSDVFPSTSDPGELDIMYVTDQVGRVAITPDTFAGRRAFRCVADPLN